VSATAAYQVAHHGFSGTTTDRIVLHTCSSSVHITRSSLVYLIGILYKYYFISQLSTKIQVAIDGHVCRNSNRLLFADQGKQTSVFLFRLQQTLKFAFPFSVSSVFRIYIYILPFQTENGSQGDFPNPFTIS
jgi:hypothetical protein